VILLEAAAEAAGKPSESDPWLMIGLAAFLTILAVALFFLEVLFPSFFLLTFMGLACVAGALMVAFSVSSLAGFVLIAITVLAIPLTVILAVRVLKGAGAVLEATTGPEASGGGVGRDGLGFAIGDRGVALTPLRPSGSARLGGRRVSVVTTGEMIEPDAQVEVVRIEGIRVVVKPVSSE
jgi:membrane-bound serine protease (ClpP class)